MAVAVDEPDRARVVEMEARCKLVFWLIHGHVREVVHRRRLLVVSSQLSAGDGRIDGIHWRLSHGCHLRSSDDRELMPSLTV